MTGNQGAELSAHERRFVRAALWKSSYRLGLLAICLLATCMTTTLVVITDTGPRTSGGLVATAIVSGVLVVACTALMLRDRQRRMPDALVAINRCGSCGYCLKGATRTESRGVVVRTCCECGRNWTNLDRRVSINEIYQCA